MPQVNNFLPAKTPGKVSAPLNLDLQGNLLQAEGIASALNITSTGAVVKLGAGRLVRINVLVAGAAGTANDCATVAAAAAANQICAIPAVVGTYQMLWPCATGIVIVPGAAQVVSVSYS